MKDPGQQDAPGVTLQQTAWILNYQPTIHEQNIYMTAAPPPAAPPEGETPAAPSSEAETVSTEAEAVSSTGAAEAALAPDAAVRASLLAEVKATLRRGHWKEPATADAAARLVDTLFGADPTLLDADDGPQVEKMWQLLEGGRGERVVIVTANLAGFLAEQNLLRGAPKDINDTLFGPTARQTGNINKGRTKFCSKVFAEVVPFLKKCVERVMRG